MCGRGARAAAPAQAVHQGPTGVLRPARPEGIELDDLSILGPMNVFKLKFAPKGFGRRLVAELWLYPDGSRILELSTKCQPSETFQVAAETKAFLGDRGVDLTGEQQTKTRHGAQILLEGAARRLTHVVVDLARPARGSWPSER